MYKRQIEYIKVVDSSISVGLVASAFYDFPSTKLKLVGVTGTNGKTTTATMLYRLIESFGYKAGLLSTVRNYIHDKVLDASHTTPDAVRVNQLLADMVAAGCEYAFMEVSSHAMKQNRVQGLHFTGGIFTNLTHDHLDYHLTFDDYLKSKKKFFDQLKPGAFAITNADDRNGKIMVQNTEAKVKTYGLRDVYKRQHLHYIWLTNQERVFRLTGEYHTIIDDKGRVKLPAGLSKQLLEQGVALHFMINRGFEKCLILYPKTVWDQKAEVVDRLNIYDPVQRNFVRYFYRGATGVLSLIHI